MQLDEKQREEEAFCLLLEHERMLKGFICSLVRNVHVAEDLLSEVRLEVFESWDKYDKTRPLGPWARGVARRVVSAYQRQQACELALFQDSVVEEVAEAFDDLGDGSELNRRKEALVGCIGCLSNRNQHLIRLRYYDNCSYREMSGDTRKTVGALCIVLSRIRKVLLNCVKKEMRSL